MYKKDAEVLWTKTYKEFLKETGMHVYNIPIKYVKKIFIVNVKKMPKISENPLNVFKEEMDKISTSIMAPVLFDLDKIYKVNQIFMKKLI